MVVDGAAGIVEEIAEDDMARCNGRFGFKVGFG